MDKSTRRKFLISSGAAGIAAFAGCGSSDSNGNGGTDGGDGNGGTDGGSGNGGTDGGSGNDPIKIGALGPAGSSIGQDMEAGTQMAIDELNQNGGINGREVQLVFKDTENDPSVADSAYTELTLQENVDVTTGGWLGGVINVIMEGMADSETLHICSGGASMQPNQMIQEDYETNKYWFRVAENSITSAKNRFTFLEENWEDFGWENIAVIYEDLAYNQPQQEYFEENFSEIGAENVYSQRYASDTSDFTSLFDEVESSGADVLYGVMAVGGTPGVTQWYNQQRPFALTGVVSAAQQSSFWNNVDGACEYFTPPIAAVPGAEITDTTVPFQEAFREEYDRYPGLTGYYGYMAVNSFAAAAEEAGTVDSDQLVPVLEEQELQTVLGTLEYYGRDNQSVHDAIQDKDHIFWQFFQWQGQNGEGVQEAIWPDDGATGEYQPPSWL